MRGAADPPTLAVSSIARVGLIASSDHQNSDTNRICYRFIRSKFSRLPGSSLMCRWQAVLKCSIAIEKVNNVAFMRLQPVQGAGGHRTDIQSIDMSGID